MEMYVLNTPKRRRPHHHHHRPPSTPPLLDPRELLLHEMIIVVFGSIHLDYTDRNALIMICGRRSSEVCQKTLNVKSPAVVSNYLMVWHRLSYTHTHTHTLCSHTWPMKRMPLIASHASSLCCTQRERDGVESTQLQTNNSSDSVCVCVCLHEVVWQNVYIQGHKTTAWKQENSARFFSKAVRDVCVLSVYIYFSVTVSEGKLFNINFSGFT